jgi:hypothetical protein
MVSGVACGLSQATNGAPFHQPGDEGHRAGQAVQLGDHQRRPPPPRQRRGKLGPVGTASALHLGELAQQRRAGVPGQEARHGLALRLKPQPGTALPVGADPIVGNKGWGHGPFLVGVYEL